MKEKKNKEEPKQTAEVKEEDKSQDTTQRPVDPWSQILFGRRPQREQSKKTEEGREQSENKQDNAKEKKDRPGGFSWI